MEIANNVLRHQLRNVYWVSGGACAGKTTIAEAIAETHGMTVYHADDRYSEHRALADPHEQQAMCEPLDDSETFFNRPTDEYLEGIEAREKEQLSMVLMDLVVLSAHGPVVAEGWFPPEVLRDLAEPQRAIFLHAAPELVRRDYFEREDKQNILAVISSLDDPQRTMKHVLDVVATGAQRAMRESEGAGIKVLVRSESSTVAEVVRLVEDHFELA